MEEKENKIEILFEKAEAYAKTNMDLFRLKTIDKAAEVVSSVATNIQWFANDLAISGATAQKYKPTTAQITANNIFNISQSPFYIRIESQ